MFLKPGPVETAQEVCPLLVFFSSCILLFSSHNEDDWFFSLSNGEGEEQPQEVNRRCLSAPSLTVPIAGFRFFPAWGVRKSIQIKMGVIVYALAKHFIPTWFTSIVQQMCRRTNETQQTVDVIRLVRVFSLTLSHCRSLWKPWQLTSVFISGSMSYDFLPFKTCYTLDLSPHSCAFLARLLTKSYKLCLVVLAGLLALLFKGVGLFIVTSKCNAFAISCGLTEWYPFSSSVSAPAVHHG